MSKFRYLPVTEQDRKEMLEVIGVDSVDDLFSDVPASVRFRGNLDAEESLAEGDLYRFMSQLAAKNINTKETPSFLGAGVYDHYIPSIVNHVISRSEFYTAYTPYQPEISQGELQAIFEFQSMICELTGMDVANSSMYDGPTALAEAALMSAGTTRKRKIVVSEAVHPEARAVIDSYARGQRLEVVEIPVVEGVTDLDALNKEVDDETASVIVQYPNFFGHVEPLKELEQLTHSSKKAMFIVSSNPLSLGLLTPPGAMGADIVVGDCQPLGISASFGGPHCGYFATTKKNMRKVPGRLVGQTVDEEGQRGFVLTLQAREQHIRRDKATSNICSNQALNALASSVAMTALGKEGVKEIAYQNLQKAHYAVTLLKEKGFEVWDSKPYFNEFVVNCGQPVAEVNRELLKKGFIGGFDLGRVSDLYKNHMLVAVTEQRSAKDIQDFVSALGGVLHD
ncbi:glycine dehydrogenase subunit 1 [Pullulanibacillus pueri]|uniref:Probable glycine dehydrogenase (decarboxylating) subunit 1 n=1 Tax=Pullulanibacillus pueri TaxID=1437324 RepID=A0A8J2ZV39_9BACL|nr:aminomethyl-transferring glycine dehydrogenase subunit GcvPA [Pullulanibacillus pueri]MBM7681561.1 glycine dehydrogenase subunit 1 [Pullulanibacillus pueri]GGH79662.1 putative glycine dehydrogenase (decarboxylating) subunit 1 [Pullulanibacillus pueri]